MPNYYPVYLNLEGQPCTVIGGGKVAERKIVSLLECGAQVQLVSPDATPELKSLVCEGKIQWAQRSYEPGDLSDSFLVIAATDAPKVNQEIYQEARSRNLLLNVVDAPKYCTFIAPSIVRQGDITLAISTAGKSPALAKRLRMELQRFLGPEYADLAKVLTAVRSQVRRNGVTIDPGEWQAGIDDKLMELVRQKKLEEAKSRLTAHLLG